MYQVHLYEVWPGERYQWLLLIAGNLTTNLPEDALPRTSGEGASLYSNVVVIPSRKDEES